MNVFFDVLDTLLTKDEVPPPSRPRGVLDPKKKGHDLYLWSSGGAGYAATAAELLGVTDLISGCFGKRGEPGVPVDFVVDDDRLVVEARGGYRITPFDGDPKDEELMRVTQAVEVSKD